VPKNVVTKAHGTLGPTSSSQSPSTDVIRHRSPRAPVNSVSTFEATGLVFERAGLKAIDVQNIHIADEKK